MARRRHTRRDPGTQPCLFAVSDDRIELKADLTRTNGSMDSILRELYISLGCALENLAQTGPPNGLDVAVSLLPQGRRLAWGFGLAGLAGLVVALVTDSTYAGLWAAMALVVVVVALLVGVVNGRRNGVGIVATRHDDLVVTHVHPAFAAAVRDSNVERLVP